MKKNKSDEDEESESNNSNSNIGQYTIQKLTKCETIIDISIKKFDVFVKQNKIDYIVRYI